jgi:hypothetical protein
MNTAQQIQSSPATAAGFDVDNMFDEVEATHRVVVIKTDEGDEKSGFIIVGKNSSQYQAENELIRIENIKRSSKRNKAVDTSTEEGAKLVAQTIANNERRLALAVVVDWFGFDSAGKPLPFDKAMVARMFDKKPTWLTEVGNALDTDGNFTKV